MNLFKIEEEKFITELNKFFLGAKKELCYVKINTNLFEDAFRKAHLFKKQLQILWHNLSYIISELIHHIVKKLEMAVSPFRSFRQQLET